MILYGGIFMMYDVDSLRLRAEVEMATLMDTICEIHGDRTPQGDDGPQYLLLEMVGSWLIWGCEMETASLDDIRKVLSLTHQ